MLAALLPDQGIDVGEMTFGGKPRGRSLDDKDKPPPQPITPVAPGPYSAAAIILLSDGRRTTGVDTLEAAKMAADRGARIYVVGLGSAGGTGGGTEEMPIYLQLDEPTMREVARMTGGEYHHAGTAEALRSVYENLGLRAGADAGDGSLGLAGFVVGGVCAGGGGSVAALVSARCLSEWASMTDPRNIAHDKRVQQEKKHRGEEIAPGAELAVQPDKKPHLQTQANTTDSDTK